MKLGFDFDNTIVSYDALFHRAAREAGHILDTVATTKNAVRDHLRQAGKEALWTELQGHVYGTRMQEAELFPHALEVLTALKNAGHTLFIISHKTQRPYLGPAYDLHEAAREWIADKLPLIDVKQVFFHEKKEDKIARIGALACDTFLDDLPEILLHHDFPKQVRRYLLGTDAQANPGITLVSDWKQFHKAVA
jgi:hypothetical protein